MNEMRPPRKREERRLAANGHMLGAKIEDDA
jgi:hypothetical protein